MSVCMLSSHPISQQTKLHSARGRHGEFGAPDPFGSSMKMEDYIDIVIAPLIS